MRRLLFVVLAVTLIGCGNQNTSSSTANPEVAGVARAEVTATLLPPTTAATVAPTRTPAPTATAQPTRTPTLAPTATAAPTATPEPTEPVATATPESAPLDTPHLSDANAPPTPKPASDVTDPSQPVELVIAGAGIDGPAVSVGLDANNIPIVPKHDIGWYNLSARPGQGENVVFWGHVLRWKDSPNIPAPFANLKDAGVGTAVTVYTADGTAHKYVITRQVWVTPDQVEYILPVGSERITLVSCIGDKVVQNGSVELTHRLITIAEPAP